MDVLIRRYGTLADVSIDGGALPACILDLLAPALSYQYVQFLRGPGAFDAVTGERQSVNLERRRLYSIDSGRLTTGYGFIPRLAQMLSAAGHSPIYIDVSPPRTRPDCYTPDWAALYRAFSLRPRQDECIRAVAAAQGGVITAPPGFGKTFLFAAVPTLYPAARVAIVVRPIDVAKRIVRQLSSLFPMVGMVGGGEMHVGRITVYTAGSVHHCDGDVDFLLGDEAHQLASDNVSAELGRIFRHSRNFSASATPYGRMDAAHCKLECLFGPQIFHMGYQEAVDLGLVTPIRVRWLDIPGPENPAANRTGVPKDRWGIWRNSKRNKAIADDINATYPADVQILVAVATVEHAVWLRQFLPDFALCYGAMDADILKRYKQNGMLPEDYEVLSSEGRDSMRRAFEQRVLKRVIATDVWSTGVDFEGVQVIYRADCRASEILDMQWPGRASRLFDGKACSEVVDCMDKFDKGFLRKSMIRFRHYTGFGWTQAGHVPRRKSKGAL